MNSNDDGYCLTSYSGGSLSPAGVSFTKKKSDQGRDERGEGGTTKPCKQQVRRTDGVKKDVDTAVAATIYDRVGRAETDLRYCVVFNRTAGYICFVKHSGIVVQTEAETLNASK